ncbi:MAG: iron-containing alcohol dehydrogenase [Firmicutes bacterium]|nr:iron-containing alcohol dehydrogenase [Bacillota bacterium]
MEIYLQNTVPVEKLCGEFECRCGGHKTLTRDIRFGAGASAALPAALETAVAKNVKLLMVTSESTDKAAAERLAAQLRKDYIVTKKIFAPCAPSLECAEGLVPLAGPETRAVVAVGGQSVCDVAKYAARASGLPLFFVPTTPAVLNCLQPYSALFDGNMRELYHTAAPHTLIADLDLMTAAPPAHAAAAFGHICALSVACFDRYFSSVVNKDYYCKETAALIRAAQDAVIADSEPLAEHDRAALCRLCEQAVRCAVYLQTADPRHAFMGGETLFALTQELYFIKNERTRRLLGENAFIAARLLARVYKYVTGEERLPEYAPFDDSLRLNSIREYLGVPEHASFKNLARVPDAADFENYRYLAREYKDELSRAAADCCALLTKAEKGFKRLYPDSGLWTRKYLTEKDMRVILALSPDIKPQYTMLTFMKHMGLLDPYLA